MTHTPTSASPAAVPPSNKAKYMTLIAAFLGWMFDGFEQGLFPLVGQPALTELLGPDSPPADAAKWFGAIIAVVLVGAAAGGVLFGWLGDKIGRVRAMSLSIFTYAIFTGVSGFATEAWHIAALRFVASLGMGGEWSLGVALVNEIWPGKSRALTAGLIGAAANFGFLLVAVLSMTMLSFITTLEGLLLGIGVSETLTAKLLANSGWRMLMIGGAIPALMIFFIRMFVPESEKWTAERDRGATTHWANVDLFGVLLGACVSLVVVWAWSPAGLAPIPATLLTLVCLTIALFSFLHPVRRYLQRAEAAGMVQAGNGRKIIKLMLFGVCLSSMALFGTWGSMQWASRWAIQLEPDPTKFAKEWTAIWLAIGAIIGAISAALAAGRFGRRITFSIMCAASIAAILVFYQGNSSYGAFFLPAAFLAGGITATFYGFFPLYLPELFPTAVRATAQGFAYNFGRIIAAVGALQTATFIKLFDGSFAMAASVMASVYLIGMVLIWFGPETRGKELPQ